MMFFLESQFEDLWKHVVLVVSATFATIEWLLSFLVDPFVRLFGEWGMPVNEQAMYFLVTALIAMFAVLFGRHFVFFLVVIVIAATVYKNLWLF